MRNLPTGLPNGLPARGEVERRDADEREERCRVMERIVAGRLSKVLVCGGRMALMFTIYVE